MIRSLAFAVALLAAAAQAQQIYTWEDGEGVTHFTDDISTVPSGKAFRTTVGDDISEVRTGGTAKEQAEAKKLQAAQAERDAAVRERDRLLAAQAPAAPQPARADLEQQWRTRFRDANNRVRDLEEAIAADAQRVETVNGMPINFNYGCLYGWGNPGVGPVYGPGSTTTQNTAGGVSVRAQGPLPGGATLGGALSVGGTSTVRTVGGSGYGSGGGYSSGCAFVSPDHQRVRERLEANRRELVRAKEDLVDLDRRASFESVPREWRR